MAARPRLCKVFLLDPHNPAAAMILGTRGCVPGTAQIATAVGRVEARPFDRTMPPMPRPLFQESTMPASVLAAPRPIHVLSLTLALGLGGPAAAQDMTAKDAWEAIHAFVEGAGGQLTATGLQRDGTALVAQGTVLRSGPAPAALTVNLGDVRIEPDDEGFTIIPAETFGIVSLATDIGEERRYTVTHDGVFGFDMSPEELALGFGFGTFALVQDSATRRGQPLDEALEASFEGLSGLTTLTLSEPFDLDGEITADLLRYSFRMVETGLISLRQTGTSETEGLALTFSAAGLALMEGSAPGYVRRAFEQGFGFEASLAAGPTTGSLDQDFDGTPIAMTLRGGDSVIEVSATEGVFRLSTEVSGYGVSVTNPIASGDVSLGRMAMGFELPVVATPTNQTFGLRLSLADLSVGDSLLGLIGASSFAGDTASFEFDLSGVGRWLVEITDGNIENVALPADFASITLGNLLTRIGQSRLTASGSFAFTPGTFLRSDAPDGTGDFVADLVGGEVLLNRLGAAGLLPPDQQFLARMMMNGVGRPVGPDHLRSELVIRPGNVITVNGAPLPF
jgi:hypothetical protein